MLSLKLNKTIVPVLVSSLPVLVSAAPIELRHASGLVTVSGELSSFSGGMITVITSAGDVTVPAAKVTCHGSACPDGVARTQVPQTISIAVTSTENMSVAQSYLGANTASSSRSPRSGRAAATDQNYLSQVSFSPAAQIDQGDVVITNIIDQNDADNRFGSLQDWTQDQAPTQLLAIKALSVVTSPGTGVDSLSLSQLAQVWSGEVTNWSQLGGIDRNITPIQSAAGTRLHADIQTAVLTPARKPASPMIFSMEGAEAILSALHTIPGAISIVPSEMAAQSTTLGISDNCGITSVASSFSIRAGDYPLTLPTLAVYNGDHDTQVMQAAFDTAASNGPQDLFHDAGFSDHALMVLPEADKNWRVANIMSKDLSGRQKDAAIDLIKLLHDARQLSMSFADGQLSQTEGAWARAHFVRLRDAINSGAMDHQEIHFIGFQSENDSDKSQDAAEAILAAFTAFAPDAANRAGVQLFATGHGGLAPIGCYNNGTVADRDTRIEVWTRPTL
jgi:phosphate transport system substrate-binding protein